MRWLLLLAAALLPLAAQADPRWDRYQVIMWQDKTVAELQGLKALGFTGGKLRATSGVVDVEGRARLQEAGMPWYAENIATDWYASYHRYTAGKTVTWRFDEAKERLRAGDLTAFHREPGLSDPAWRERVRARLVKVVGEERAARPLFYNLADESGIGDLAAAWDADTSAGSLAGMRGWLRTQYADLDALNRQWGSGFARWEDVVPELTEAALRRTDDNYSSWSDFKAWMDVAFTDAVRAGAEAVHEGDAGALAGLEGGQVPGWGGYDYALLAPSVDVMEVYDYGNALDLATAFNPALIPLRTSFGAGAREVHEAWRSVLHGGRGMIVWDERGDVVQADGAAGPRGREIAALVKAIDEVMPALRAARPAPDPVAVLVDQESFRLGWLLDRRAGDRDWAARDAEREYDDNAWRASRRVLVERLAGAGVQPRFVSTAMVERGLTGVRVLFLPHAISLSDAAVAAIQAFRAGGGTVLADTEPGVYDGHGRRRGSLPLPEVGHPEAVRVDSGLAGLIRLLREAGAGPRIEMLGPDGAAATGVEARWFAGPGGAILGLQAARPWGAASRITLRLAAPAAITDLRRPGPAVVTDRLEVALDGVEPTILSLVAQ